MFEVLACRHEGLRQAWFQVPGVHREIEDGDSGIAQAIRDVGAEKAAICSDVNSESFLRPVIDDLVDKVRAE